MSDFHVWAPNASSVELVLDPPEDLRQRRASERTIVLHAGHRGWWKLSAPQIAPGTNYAFSVDGGAPVPDPRSPWQPYGVHGPSRTVDHALYPWADRRWESPPWGTAIVYELHIGTFTPEGTYESAAGKLAHLIRLGVTHVELMPVNEFPGRRGWGYDGVDLFAPHHAYGSPQDLKRFVETCHSFGLAVLLDVVYNHLGPDGNYLAMFGPYFTDKYKTPWGQAVNLDGPGSVEVRRFFCDNARMWLRDYHFDGLRLDATHAMIDQSAMHFLEQLTGEVRGLGHETGRHYQLIAENDLNDPRIVTLDPDGGYGLDAQWNDDFHHALHSVLTGECGGYYADFGAMADLAKCLKDVYVYDGRESSYRGRVHGRRVQGLSGHRFVAFLQNHDQIGNRAVGDRLGSSLSPAQLKIGAALVLCSPFVPLLFQGEEFGAATPFQYFTDHVEPAVAAAVSEGRRKEFAAFGWDPASVPDPQSETTFHASQLDWAQITRPPHSELLQWFRALISLRRAIPALHDGLLAEVNVEFSEAERWLVLYRQSIMIVCNFGNTRRRIAVRFTGRPRLASDSEFSIGGDSVEVSAESVLILDHKEPSA